MKTRHVDILEVKAQFTHKGGMFLGDDCQVHIIGLDGTFLDFDEATDGVDDGDGNCWLARADCWAIEFRAAGDGLPNQSMLESESDALGWQDIFGKQGAAIVADAAAVRERRIQRARDVTAPLIDNDVLTEARAKLVKIAEQEPLAFVAAVETVWSGDGEDVESSSTYLGRIDCRRLPEILVRSHADG